ncbi:hypothetical protein EV178_000993 [Coemansia sp. RSA 1646]|nr:hypothetical protein EV178_000993 [Coemansia sp. RSA 1646]
MSSTDGTKRQRTDDRQSKSTSPEPSISSKAYSLSAPNLPQIAEQETTMPAAMPAESRSDLGFCGLLERLLASQERLADDVARLQATVDTVLAALRQPQFAHGHSQQHQSLGRDHRLSVPISKHSSRNSPPLPSILPPQSQNTDRYSATAVSTSAHGTLLRGKSPAASSSSAVTSISPNPQSRHPSIAGPADDGGHGTGAGAYRLAVAGSEGYAHDYYPSGMRNPASNYYSTPPPPHPPPQVSTTESHQSISSSITLPPPASLSRTLQPTSGHSHTTVPRIRSPQPVSSNIHGRQYQQHHPHTFTQQQQQQQPGLVLPPPSATPMSAPSSASSLFSPTRYHPQSQLQLQQQQQQQQKKTVSRLSHQGHMQYNARPASASPHRMHHQHMEQSVSLPPIICTTAPSSATAAVVGHGYGSAEDNSSIGVQPSSSVRGFAMSQKPTTPRTASNLATGTGASPYSPASSLVSGMIVDATPTASKPSPSPQSATLPGFSSVSRVPPPLNRDASTPTSGGMVESPRGSSVDASGLRSHRHNDAQHHATGGASGRSYSTDAGSGPGTVLAQNKVEKNRFQANIRSFVDNYFTVPTNPRWDYQQSFKAPRNAQTTQHIIEVFHSAHGGTYERIEHGLGVYFSSLKAKHRTTEDKAMLKQQRDRRRARRIKKAAGRRKVFDQSRYPFLPPDFDMQTCFVPVAMSPEHTDDDGEVKVGILPWRRDTFTRLFKHLDTLRPKRTPRPSNTKLSDRSVPPSDIPAFLIDPAYIAVDRAERDSHGPEEDIEMESLSDDDEMHGSPPAYA